MNPFSYSTPGGQAEYSPWAITFKTFGEMCIALDEQCVGMYQNRFSSAIESAINSVTLLEIITENLEGVIETSQHQKLYEEINIFYLDLDKHEQKIRAGSKLRIPIEIIQRIKETKRKIYFLLQRHGYRVKLEYGSGDQTTTLEKNFVGD